MVFVFHRLAYFTYHHILQFHPCCCKRQAFLLSVKEDFYNLPTSKKSTFLGSRISFNLEVLGFLN